jgi:LysR family transcriptional regulator, regulator for genes of the gallate degradation pathway
LLNTRHLRAFVAVATLGSVVKSSTELRRAQSAITRAVKELESEVGAPLFERRPQGMLLTAFGRALLGRAERAFAEMETARQAFATAHPTLRTLARAPIFALAMSRQRLLVFVELVEQHHMGAVADTIGISQPAASQALREIESGLGLRLFTRTAGGLQPTALGALLGMHLRRALAEVRAGELEIASLQGALAGRVVLGTLSLGRTRLLPAAIIRLRKQYPHLTVSTVEGSFEHLAMRLRSGDIDFMLGALRDPEHTVGLAREVVAHDELSLVVRSGHPLARRRSIAGADLTGLDWVLPPRGTPTRELLEKALALRGLDRARVGVETADLAITRGILLGSDMITAVSAHLYHHEVTTRTLAVLPFALPETQRQIGILHRGASAPSLAARLLIEQLHAIGHV